MMSVGGRCPPRRHADMPDGFPGQVGLTVSWLAVRPEPWRDAASDPAISSSGLRLVQPAPLLGVMCLMFGVGPGALAWSERLAGSNWYAAMRPRHADLADNGQGYGHAVLVADEIAARFPEAWLATVALIDGASTADINVVFNLVQALGDQVDEGGRRLRVIVTVGSVEARRPAVVATLRQLGATVIRGAEGMEPDHLHHFPMRAALRSPSGRLVCVDLADCLMCWPSGRVGDLHLIPFNAEAAEHVLQGIAVPSRLDTVTIIAHFPEEGPDSSLVAMDTLANRCGVFLFGSYEKASMLFTSGDRLDGVTGTADLLLIHNSG